MPLLALLVVLPLIEIGLFVTLGAWLGLWTTLMVVLASALLGVAVIRRQGIVTMLALREAMAARRDPGPAMADGALSVLAGSLLILPGFLTSVIGLLLLIPASRAGVAGWARRQMQRRGVQFRSAAEPGARPEPADTIEGDFFEIDAAKRPTHRPSGWTRH